MKKLLICLCLAAATARIITPMPWEAETRTAWHQYATELRAADPAEANLIREIQALPDSAYRAPANQQSALSNQQF